MQLLLLPMLRISPRMQQGQGHRIITHVDQRAKDRYQAFHAVAKSIREQSKFELQTNIIIGKNDYLLRQRNKGTNTPWQQIPPVMINKKLPQFQIVMYQELDNTSSSSSEDNDSDEDIEILENYINNQYKTFHKRKYKNKGNQREIMRHHQTQTPETNKQNMDILNSTPKSIDQD